MVVKTITVTEEAYESLKRAKHENESFSEVLTRLGSNKKSITDFLGLLKDSEESAENIQAKTRETRKRASEGFRKRREKLFPNT